MADPRTTLAEQQTQLLTALSTGSEAPPGFDPLRVAAAGRALAFKRRRALFRAWPLLTEALGERCKTLLTDYVAATTLPGEGGPVADGYAFTLWLEARGDLPDESRRERLGYLLHLTPAPDGLHPRRWPAILHDRLASGRWMFAFTWPGWWQWWVVI